MQKLGSWLILLVGILLILHMANILPVTEGIGGWILAIIVLMLGIIKIAGKK